MCSQTTCDTGRSAVVATFIGLGFWAQCERNMIRLTTTCSKTDIQPALPLHLFLLLFILLMYQPCSPVGC